MRIELFGMARAIVGGPSIGLIIEEPAPLCEVLQALAKAHPELIDAVLDRDNQLIEPNVVLLDGRRAVDPHDAISAADKPCIVLLPSGG